VLGIFFSFIWRIQRRFEHITFFFLFAKSTIFFWYLADDKLVCMPTNATTLPTHTYARAHTHTHTNTHTHAHNILSLTYAQTDLDKCRWVIFCSLSTDRV